MVIILVAVVAVTWFLSRALRDFHLEQTALDLEARAHLVMPQVAALLSPSEIDRIDMICKRLGAETATRLTVVLPSGKVLGDSVEEPFRMDNHAGRPEIAAAIGGEVGVSTRFSHTLQQRMMYVALPVRRGGEIVGSVRAAIAVTAIDRTLHAIYQRMAFGGLAIALLAALVSLQVSRRISRPLEMLRRGVERFARGDLDRRLAISGSEEIGHLAEAMNAMAVHLSDRIETVRRQGAEREAMLASMVEGVLAVDEAERILRLNAAAGRLLGVDPAAAEGRAIQEVVRKVDLQRFVRRALEGEETVEGDVVLQSGGEERFLQAHGSVLRGVGGSERGVLIVLNDVTRLRRLENLRREFVANVSHELKTPITAIKGSAEALAAGALEEPEAARRFVEIVGKQADRLSAIIDDLLALSRIEQGEEQEGVALEERELRPVLEAAVQACSLAAREKSLQINLSCPEELRARINAPLFEQAVVNLLTNAIKYSEERKSVALDAARLDDRVMIKVQDWGSGIGREHLPRLFERFYRVDKARSRALGGTGLGLAIVKHIVQAHGGEVLVESALGRGSIFTIVLPTES